MKKIIDIHTHFFNLKYLPIAGILVRYADPYISHKIAIAIEHLLLSRTRSVFDDSNEILDSVHISDKYLQVNSLKGASETNFLKKDFYQIKKEIVNDIADIDFMEPNVLEGLQEFQEKALSENFIADEEAIDFSKKQASLLENDVNIFKKLRNLFERLIEWICTKVKQLSNYFKWFRFMQKSEEEILEYLMKKDEAGVDIYIHHMMDVDNFFNTSHLENKYSSHFDFAAEQIMNMSKLNQKYQNKIFGFVAFDPSKENCVDIIKDAIENKGFKGIKFYPPMGYRSFNDPKYKIKIDSLFQYCIEKDIPLFAHCNKEGFEAQPKMHSGYNSNPMYWYNTLRQYPDLRLCLAHAGGGEGWFSEVAENDQITKSQITDLLPGEDEKQENWNSSYAKIVFKLCVSFKNVYCDVAYLDELSDVSKYSYLRMRLNNLFKSEPDFSKKIIYGSDWHMLFQEGINSTYMENYIALFNEIGFTEENREDFFRNNAIKFLKLPINP